MLLSESVALIVAWAVRVAIVIGALVLATRFWDKQAHTKQKGLGAAGGVVLVLGLVAAFFAGRFASGTPVLIVRGEGTERTRVDRRLYGSTTHAYPNGASEHLRWRTARQLVVNDTPQPLFVESILYSGARGEKPPTVRIEPYSTGPANGRIDHFGMGDHAPARSKKPVRLRLWWEPSYP